MTNYRRAIVDGSCIFYREAGSKDAPTIVLLHGFPTSSHMFRNLIPLQADRFPMVALDLPGFGFSDASDRKRFRYNAPQTVNTPGLLTLHEGPDESIYAFSSISRFALRLGWSTTANKYFKPSVIVG